MKATIKDSTGFVSSITYIADSRICLEFGGARQVTIVPYMLAWGVPIGGSISFTPFEYDFVHMEG